MRFSLRLDEQSEVLMVRMLMEGRKKDAEIINNSEAVRCILNATICAKARVVGKSKMHKLACFEISKEIGF